MVSAYLDDPGPDALGPLRRAVRGSAGFTPDLDLDEADRLLAEGSYAAATAELQRAMPGAIFSPSAHLRMAAALERSGDERSAARERQVARAALRSIRSTGDGSEQRPWSVLRINDEYDMLRAMGKTPVRQSLLRRGARDVDRHETTDGGVYHFDATQLVAH
nr:DUF4919 domain-containing protein [Nocardioides panzhihuensis]